MSETHANGDPRVAPGTVLFGYRHVEDVPLCPCRDPGNYMMCEQGADLLSFRLRCWCGSTMEGTWDDEGDRSAFLGTYGDEPPDPAPSEADIALDEDGLLSDGNHDDIAHAAGYLTDDEYDALNEQARNASQTEPAGGSDR